MEDAASHAGDYTLPATDNLNEAMRKAGDLIERRVWPTKASPPRPPAPTPPTPSQPGGSEDVECEHVDEDTATTAADGLCDKCEPAREGRERSSTVEGCQHIGT